MKRILLILSLLFLQACAQQKASIIPIGYTGGTASINDTYIKVSRREAHVFHVQLINESIVDNAADITNRASSNGIIYPAGFSRDVPAQPMRIRLSAQKLWGAPLFEALSSDTNVSFGDTIQFTPKENALYLVKGHFGESHSEIWLEDTHGNVVSEVIQFDGKNTQTVPASNTLEPKTRNVRFLTITGGESLASIVQKIGEPDEIEQRRPSFGTPFSPTSIFRYKDLGEIYMAKYGSVEFASLIKPASTSVNSADFSLEEQLKTSDPTRLQELGKIYYSLPDLPERDLDLFASKIWEARYDDDAYMVEAMSWFCKVLGQSKNSRYSTFLRSLSEDEISGKLKRYARSSLKQLDSENRDQFSP